MQLPPFIRLVPEDVPGAPSWFQPVFGVVDQLCDRLNIFVRGNIDWSNISSELQTITATSGVPVTVTLQVLKVQPTIVLPVYSSGQAFTASITGYSSLLQPIVTITNATNPTGAQSINVRFLP